MIQFRLIPIKNNKYLQKEDDSLICYNLEEVDYVSLLKKKLQKDFHTKFEIARTIEVLNNKEDIILYTIVVPETEFIISGYEWNDHLKTNDEFDSIALNKLMYLLSH